MSLGDALARAPTIVAARRALGERADVWVVGGGVRDAALGRDVLDADLALAGDPAEAARQIASETRGPAFELSCEFATWRVLLPGGGHLDVTALRGDRIEEDLRLRDFTANALAVPLAELAAAPLDPTGGLADLERRLLRAASERSFEDDPLRILRAARLAAGLRFELQGETRELARASSARAGEPAGERQFAELRLLVGGPDPVRGLRLLDELDATPAVLPEFAALHGVGQNPNHHLDVHGHTVEVLSNLLDVEADLERYAGESAGEVRTLLAEPLADSLTRGEALRFGAILHDTGKPATRREQGGLVSFIGHDREGARVVRDACARLRTSRATARHLEALAFHHLHLGFMATEHPLARRRLYDYLRLTEPVAADVTLLTVADRLAARGTGPTASAQMIEAHLELARAVLPAALAWHRDGPPRAPVAGDELAAALGIAPGPELGRLLGEIEAAVFAGEVSERDSAIELARRSLARAGPG